MGAISLLGQDPRLSKKTCVTRPTGRGGDPMTSKSFTGHKSRSAAWSYIVAYGPVGQAVHGHYIGLKFPKGFEGLSEGRKQEIEKWNF
ncbi:hypothetical protein ASG77_01920 [Arthrobacter sp. Soil762]|nr:hypothetical protein ASG77_01920 [Arthrobacter sp. Soil762]